MKGTMWVEVPPMAFLGIMTVGLSVVAYSLFRDNHDPTERSAAYKMLFLCHLVNHVLR